MGKVEECVERKLSEHGTPGQKPSEQDLAIKYAECRDDHPGGDAGFGESKEQYDFKFAGSSDDEENEDINQDIAQSMHEAHFDQPLVTEAMTIDMINKSKWGIAKENKETVLGMAYNYHDKIFKDDKIEKGNSFSNDVSQEMMTEVMRIQQDWPQTEMTKEFLALELHRRGYDPALAIEFVNTALEIEPSLYPNVASIPQTEDVDLEVPNQNARTDFKPTDIMMGGIPRQDYDTDTITQDKKPNLGTAYTGKHVKRISVAANKSEKNSKRSGNQDGYNEFGQAKERLRHVANSTMARSPESGYMGQSLEQTLDAGMQMDMPAETPGPCDPGKQLNPVTGTCDEGPTLDQVNNPDLGVTAGIPGGESLSKKN
jgi:hypothetical protein